MQPKRQKNQKRMRTALCIVVVGMLLSAAMLAAALLIGDLIAEAFDARRDLCTLFLVGAGLISTVLAVAWYEENESAH